MSAIKALDELNNWIDGVAIANPQVFDRGDCAKLRTIADAIDREIAENYLRLPVDADGTAIRPGERVYSDIWHDGATVYEIGFTDNDGVRVYDESSAWALASRCSHVKPRTLEDVLADVRDGNLDSGDAADEIRELML